MTIHLKCETDILMKYLINKQEVELKLPIAMENEELQIHVTNL